tara:strand:+ start:293 stop:2140 length:1848 start_codon:yes stop_codon:yes gene_type:complete
VARNIKKEVKRHKEVSYLQKDFQSFRRQLENFSRQHYGEKIADLTEGSIGGMFLDIAAYVGDSMSFYLDHQFNELSLETAIEEENIEAHIRQNGVEISGPAASVVDMSVRIKVPAKLDDGDYVPDPTFIPKILGGSIFVSSGGTEFSLLDTIDFSKKDELGNYLAEIQNYTINNNNVVTEVLMTIDGRCTSAKTHTETISIGDSFVPFRTIKLEKSNVSEIISIIDSSEDEYYEVESLTQDTVFERMENTRHDSELVQERIRLIPAPKRFIKSRSRRTGSTTIRFGSGNEEKFDEDIVPDPSEHAIRLYGDRKTFSKISIDPNSLLDTNTLGVSPRNTVLTIVYRHGGGLDNNVPAGSIQTVRTLLTKFNSSVPSSQVAEIRSTLSVINKQPASGGEDEPSLEELRTTALFAKTSQGRVVTREDLIARVYSMPSNLGRTFRVSVRDNPSNPLSAQLHIVSRDSTGRLILSPDSLKENLAVYLSQYRIISDSIDILDTKIINLALRYAVNIESSVNPETTVQRINASLIDYFKIENFQIDQPIMIGDIENIILNTRGVLSVASMRFLNRAGNFEDRQYSLEGYSPNRNLDRGMLFPPRGGIFEFRHPSDDIIGRVN